VVSHSKAIGFGAACLLVVAVYATQRPAGRESDTVAGLRGLHPTARPRGLCALWTRAGRASLDFGFRARRSGNSRSAFSR